MKPSKTPQSIPNMVTIVTLLFFTLFPLIVDDYYYNITITKYNTFAVLATVMLFCIFYYMFCEKPKFYKKSGLTFCQHMTCTDRIFLAFLLANSFSCLCSPWRSASFTGAEGKYVGLLFVLLCGCVYYGISYFFVLPSWFEKLFPTMLTLLCLMALVQSFGYDIFGFFENMAESYKPMYLATFGHINLFSVFLAVYLPITLYLFCFAKNRRTLLFYGVSIGFGCMGTFCSNSDSGYLGLFLSLALLFPITAGRKDAFEKYSFSICILTLSALLWRLAAHIFAGHMREISTLTRHLTSWSAIFCLAVLSLALLGIVIHDRKKQISWSSRLKYPVITLLLVAFLLLAGVILWFSAIDTTTDLGTFENYLRFNHAWGSNRGYVWSWLMEFFLSSTLFNKLFGTGPDTTALILSSYFSEEMAVSGDGSYYTTAHNEYLNYLVTIGLVGVILYIIILVLSVRTCMKKASKTPFYGAVGLAIVCYAVTAVLTISQPITMPFIFLLIALANTKQS